MIKGSNMNKGLVSPNDMTKFDRQALRLCVPPPGIEAGAAQEMPWHIVVVGHVVQGPC